MDLSGTTALVTGAASGLGAAAARRLAGLGATVVVADLQAEKGEALAAEISGVFAQVDVTSTAQITAAVEAAAAIAPLRAVVNSAGIGGAQRTVGRDGTLESAHSLEMFAKVVAINLIGTFDVVRQAATVMSHNTPDADGCRGAIVNLASVAAFDGQIGQASYAASKGGVVGMTLPVARDLAAVGIRLNTVAPGLIDTPIYGEGEEAEAFKARLGESVLFPKRLGSADELASMVLECLTNPYMNGEVVRVDGGIRMPPEVSDLDALRGRFVSRDGAVLVLGSAVQAAGTAGWVAAAELTPARRRAARVLVLVAAVTAGVLLDVEDDDTGTAADTAADADAPPEPAAARPGWQRVVLVLMTALAAVASLGGSVLERRWLARLDMWVCINGHDVRDGAFVCPRCGSDAVADPDRTFEPVPTQGRDAVRIAARKELRDRLTAGVLLIVGGLFLIGLSLGAASDGDSGWVVSLLVVLAQLAFAVGAGFVLIAVVGHGVRLGIETARSDPSD